MREFFEELRAKAFNRTTLAICLAITAVTFVAGPFGTYSSMSPLVRVSYWGAIAGISTILGFAVNIMIARYQKGWPLWQAETINAVVFTLVFTLPAWGLTLKASSGMRDTSISLSAMFFYVFLIASAIGVARFLFISTMHVQVPSRPRLYDRLPDTATGEIGRLTVRDHYVCVHMTSKEQYDLLMRFSDAVAEMDGVKGYSTHRSHWVACQVIDQPIKRKGRDFLRLNCGTEIPVSRTFRPRLVEAGYLAG